MYIKKISIQNFRSIVSVQDLNITRLQAFIGENNAGKSNLLLALDSFINAGSAGVGDGDFHDVQNPIQIKCTFGDLNEKETKVWKRYLKANELELIKVFTRIKDEKTGKVKIETEFHGFESEPVMEHLSIRKLEEKKADWTKTATDSKLPAYFFQNGKATKATYSKGLEQYLRENDVEYESPKMKETQALGLKSNVIASLPKIFILPAITSYKEETDSRKSSTIFNRLVGEITERILKVDPKYKKLDEALTTMSSLFNDESGEGHRFEKLDQIERVMTELVKKLMPSVNSMRLVATIDGINNFLRQSIEFRVDDGLATEVLAKGHGLQRCIIFSMLQSLIKSERNQLIEGGEPATGSIILLIEEPELYIHAQLRSLFFDALESFASSDQVIFATHSSDFVDISNFTTIALVRKENLKEGTKVLNPEFKSELSNKEKFKKLTKVNTHLNEILFAKKVVLVEGPEDKIAIVQGLIGLGKIERRPEEIGLSIIASGGKQSLPDIIRVLNAFKLNYIVAHDTDLLPGLAHDKRKLREDENTSISELISEAGSLVLFDPKLENILGLQNHFRDQYDALTHMMDYKNHTLAFKELIGKIAE